jgi:hypothetical protein
MEMSDPRSTHWIGSLVASRVGVDAWQSEKKSLVLPEIEPLSYSSKVNYTMEIPSEADSVLEYLTFFLKVMKRQALLILLTVYLLLLAISERLLV